MHGPLQAAQKVEASVGQKLKNKVGLISFANRILYPRACEIRVRGYIFLPDFSFVPRLIKHKAPSSRRAALENK